MSTNTSTEATIAAAQRIDELLPQAIRARSMEKLWADEGNALRAMMLAAADEMGVKPGDKWATKAGTIAVTVRSGAMDWEAKCKALEAAAAALLQGLNDVPWSRLQAVAAAIAAPVPQKAASEPFLTITPSKDLPPPIEQARREGALQVLRLVDDPALTHEARRWLDEIADQVLGGWPDGWEEETP